MSHLDDLRKKQEMLRSDYEHFLIEPKLQPESLDKYEVKLFNSMSRWHANSHVTEDEWVKAFNKISVKMDVREKMQPLSASFAAFLR